MCVCAGACLCLCACLHKLIPSHRKQGSTLFFFDNNKCKTPNGLVPVEGATVTTYSSSNSHVDLPFCIKVTQPDDSAYHESSIGKITMAASNPERQVRCAAVPCLPHACPPAVPSVAQPLPRCSCCGSRP